MRTLQRFYKEGIDAPVQDKAVTQHWGRTVLHTPTHEYMNSLTSHIFK